MSKIEVNTIETASGSTLTVGKSGDTVTLASGASQSGFKAIDWQSVVTGDTTMVAGRGYIVNTSGGDVTMTLPASPSAGDEVSLIQSGSNTTTIARNSSNIESGTSNLTMTQNSSIHLVYSSESSIGWVKANNDIPDSFISATGGTTTTSGNFKIHTFNSSSNFVVASVSNVSANNDVSYMVVAGGASGGGGTGSGEYEGAGGGAGGYRESKSPIDSYTASPTAATGGLTVTAQTYPITVGGGGSAQSSPFSESRGNNGSNSVFSTITSAGGGAGGSRNTPVMPGLAGGSGGGAGQKDDTGPAPLYYAGAGNTPPVSPSQGNPGGTSAYPSSPSSSGGGGGGGAGSAGTAATPGPAVGGNGGSGVASSITGSPVTRAAGGGGAGTATPGGLPTSGPGGQGASNGRSASAGSANTGGGGGGSGGARPGEAGGVGGSGVVIIRYKYQ